jgi:hypothetical protein
MNRRLTFISTLIGMGLLLVLCQAPQPKQQEVRTTYPPYDDSQYIKCDTDAECEEMHGHDMYGRPTNPKVYGTPPTTLIPRPRSAP